MNTGEVEILMIGKDIPWDDIKGEFLRVESFLPLSTIEGKKIRSLSLFEARAYLKVHSPHLIHKASGIFLPVLHKLDFRHFGELYQERGVSAGEEVLVIYKPLEKGIRKLLKKRFHTYLLRFILKEALRRYIITTMQSNRAL